MLQNILWIIHIQSIKRKKFWHGDLKHQSSPLKKMIMKYN